MFRLLGRVVLRGCCSPEASKELRRVQQHLADSEPQRAWAAAEALRQGEEDEPPNPDEKRQLPQKLETLATLGVAAAATARFEVALDNFGRAELMAAAAGDRRKEDEFASLVARAEALLAMSRGEREPAARVPWKPQPLAPVQVPETWARWVAALPDAAEYVGPVKVDWVRTCDPAVQTTERGLFATRDVQAGELLMVARPLAQAAVAQDLEQLVRKNFDISMRTRRTLAALSSSGANVAMEPEQLTRALCNPTDDLPPTVKRRSPRARPEPAPTGAEICAAVSRNAIHMTGGCALYGLLSLMNDSCGSWHANVVKHKLRRSDNMLAIIATRDIQEGEEIRRNYADTDSSGRVSNSTCHPHAEKVSTAISSSTSLFTNTLRQDMRELGAKRSSAAPTPEVVKRSWELLEKLLLALRSVEEAVNKEREWSEEERLCCMAEVQPLMNAALWCVIGYKIPSPDPDGKCTFDPEDVLFLRLLIQERLVATWRVMGYLSADHLRTLQMYWSACDEARVRTVARLAAVPARGLPRSRATCMEGPEFFEAAKGAGGLQATLQQAGGLLWVNNFLPQETANQAHALLRSLGSEEWILSTNFRREDADHRFRRYEGSKVDWLRSHLTGLQPGMHPHFNAARYDRGGRISLHNDASCWEVEVASPKYPEGTQVYRKIAVIYYLTKEWKEEYGGMLVDNTRPCPETLKPEFNAMVCFLVPREHWVTEVAEGAPNRYSIFGWFSDTEPYPPGCPLPLGSGNKGRETGAEAAEVNADLAQGPSAPATAAAPAADCSVMEANSSPMARAAKIVARMLGSTNGNDENGQAHSMSVDAPHSQKITASRQAYLQADAARKACEAAFKVRFGISPEELRLGQAGSPAAALIESAKC